jgi:hypothetical protein
MEQLCREHPQGKRGKKAVYFTDSDAIGMLSRSVSDMKLGGDENYLFPLTARHV